MKQIILALGIMIASVSAFAQTSAPQPTATPQKAENFVKFKEMTHDFGKIKQNVPVTYDFAFSNISSKPVVIESATASCGCTTPVKPEAPIAKGKNDKITAGFNAVNLGPFTKSILVKIAGVDQPVEIKITGEVLNEIDYAKYEKEKGPRKS